MGVRTKNGRAWNQAEGLPQKHDCPGDPENHLRQDHIGAEESKGKKRQ